MPYIPTDEIVKLRNYADNLETPDFEVISDYVNNLDDIVDEIEELKAINFDERKSDIISTIVNVANELAILNNSILEYKTHIATILLHIYDLPYTK